MPRNTPWSSSGASSDEVFRNRKPVVPIIAATMISVAQRTFSVADSMA